MTTNLTEDCIGWTLNCDHTPGTTREPIEMLMAALKWDSLSAEMKPWEMCYASAKDFVSPALGEDVSRDGDVFSWGDGRTDKRRPRLAYGRQIFHGSRCC